VNIQPGWTNVFTAMWDSDLVYLRPSTVLLSPGATWQNRGDVYWRSRPCQATALTSRHRWHWTISPASGQPC